MFKNVESKRETFISPPLSYISSAVTNKSVKKEGELNLKAGNPGQFSIIDHTKPPSPSLQKCEKVQTKYGYFTILLYGSQDFHTFFESV